jgi:hypothetical protein
MKSKRMDDNNSPLLAVTRREVHKSHRFTPNSKHLISHMFAMYYNSVPSGGMRTTRGIKHKARVQNGA